MKTMDEFRREETPCARKEHRCDLCHQMIAKGEKYVHIVSSDSGDVFDSKYHTGCYDLVCRYITNEGGYVDAFDEANVIDAMQDRVCLDCAHKAECELKYRQTPTCPHIVERYLR